ncbi:MAG: hypothetical protein ACREJN_04180 [Nitrospiraceae bacterium]
MAAIQKIIGVMSCGVLLCLGLSGYALLAVDVLQAGQSGDRIGGQAGRGYEQVKQQHIAVTHAGERIGGQAGRGYEQVKQQHIAATHSGERIGGQAGLDEMEGMGK